MTTHSKYRRFLKTDTYIYVLLFLEISDHDYVSHMVAELRVEGRGLPGIENAVHTVCTVLYTVIATSTDGLLAMCKRGVFDGQGKLGHYVLLFQ